MKRYLAILLSLVLSACAPLAVQRPARPDLTFQEPRLDPGAFVSFDGARLGLSTWEAKGEPWAVIIAVHGMNDYANAFHLAAPWWAEQGVTTIAYDQRGFGRSPGRGLWAGEDLMVEDLRTLVTLVRARYPNAVLAIAGESMGGAVTIAAATSEKPLPVDRIILLSPAVWGWSTQPVAYKAALRAAAHADGAKVYEAPRWLATLVVTSTDNRAERIQMGRDPLMIWGARSDTLYGLVDLMETAWTRIDQLKGPAIYLYGAKDQTIPKGAAFTAAAKLRPEVRTAYYAQGWHLLTRDMQGPKVWADILSFIRDPKAPLPSGAPPIPSSPHAAPFAAP